MRMRTASVGIRMLTLVVFALFGGAFVALAAVPPPPVNQNLGIGDSSFNNLDETGCRACHDDPNIIGDTSNVDRHHLRMGTIVPDPTAAPNGTPGEPFECLTCHTLVWNPVLQAYEFAEFRDCLLCHQQIPGQASVHHLTAKAQARDCVACHGDLVDNFDDGHYIPTYDPSLVTPWPKNKPNPGPNGEGNCNFCHNAGTENGLLVLTNGETHHSTGFPIVPGEASCSWCHNLSGTWNAFSIRTCEECHGISSLHNIQFDNLGDGIDPGNEASYYGHIGNNDDCWGCHGFTSGASAPASGPVIPSVDGLSAYAMVAGVDNALTITGSGFINRVQNPITGEYDITLECDVRLTDATGSEMTLEPTSVTPVTIEVVLPASLGTGSYKLAAVKGPNASNPVGVALTPPVVIDSVTCSDGIVAVSGSGFSAYVDAIDSGTEVNSLISGVLESGVVISWSDSWLLAEFPDCGDTVEVSSIFGTAMAGVSPAVDWGTASVIGVESGSTSEIGNCVAFILVPIGGVLLWKRRNRRR